VAPHSHLKNSLPAQADLGGAASRRGLQPPARGGRAIWYNFMNCQPLLPGPGPFGLEVLRSFASVCYTLRV
jgi:hypothetical protein